MNNSLENRAIVITREEQQAKTTISEIRKFGGRCVLFPTIKIVRSENRSGAETAVENLGLYDWLIFTSTNTINCFDELAGAPDLVSAETRIAAIGDKTADALDRHGMKVHLVPDTFSSEGLIEAFRAVDLEGKRILQPCSAIAPKTLPAGLESLGAVVDQVIVYDTVPNEDLDAGDMRRSLESDKIDCLTFFSPSAFEYFAIVVGDGLMDIVRNKQIPVATIGRTTARSVEARGIENILIPETSDEEHLVKTVVEYFDGNRKLENQ